MTNRRVGIYVWLVCLAAMLGIAVTDWRVLVELPSSDVAGLIGLIAIGVLAEALAIGLSVGASASTSSITFLPLLAALQLFGPAAAIVLIATTQVFGEIVVRRKGVLKGTFNIAQAILATAVAGSAFLVLDGQPLYGNDDINMASQLWPFVSFGLLFLAVNHAAVALAITLSQGLSFRRVWRQVLANSGASLNDVLISPIALAVAFLYVQFEIAGILVLLLPMLFVRYSYLTTSKLRDANADLLTALVKAIEIRDPYTSGHSLRVSQLAQQIAEELGLSRLSVDLIANAALLHDVGKMEAVYTEILRKPGALTAEERAIMESHVLRGVRLLQDLSSVPDEVVRIVRHHHEREDGKGYPDGLLGDEIPIGSKIIVLCDAVDAMLSDRPYRDALPLSDVLEQLELNAGRQFDHRVVRAATRSEILVEFAETMSMVRVDTSASAPVDAPTTPSGLPRVSIAVTASTQPAYH
jgi:putative nucleotidyltransferase with HDIG domain